MLSPDWLTVIVVVIFVWPSSGNQLLQLLYLECILSMLASCPPTMHLSRGFTDLVWSVAISFLFGPPGHQVSLWKDVVFLPIGIQRLLVSCCRKQLCPSLVALMGNPVSDKTITSYHGHTGVLVHDRLFDRLGESASKTER